MGKARCKENREFSQAMQLLKRHETALRKAEKSVRNGEVEKILLGGVVACKEAIVKLVRMRGRHQKTCEECRKGR